MKSNDPAFKFLPHAFRKRPKKRTSQSVELQFEKLEPRQMLAGDLVFQADFEDVNVPLLGYRFFSQVSGLRATGAPVEVQHHYPLVGPASQGNNLLELDGTNGVFVQIANVPSNGLLLQGDYSPRPGYDALQNRIVVLWNGSIVGTLGEDGRANETTDFQRFEFTLPATAAATGGRLVFRSAGVKEVLGVGGLLDDIKVFEFGDAARPPKLNPISDRTINAGENLSLRFTATDPDSNQNQLRYSLVRAPKERF